MYAFEVRDIGELFSGGGVDHHDVRAAGNEQTVGGCVISKIIPATVTANRMFLRYGKLI